MDAGKLQQSKEALAVLSPAQRSSVAALVCLLSVRRTREDSDLVRQWVVQLQAELKLNREDVQAVLSMDRVMVDVAPHVELLVGRKKSGGSTATAPAAAPSTVEAATAATKDYEEKDLEMEERCWAAVKTVLGVCLAQGTYDARARVLLRRMVGVFGFEWIEFTVHEDELASIIRALKESSGPLTEGSERTDNNRSQKIRKWAMIGAAGVAGGLVIGITGGLAAPVIAGALAGLGIGGTFLGSAAGIAFATTFFGATGASLTGLKMARRIKGMEELEFEQLRGGDRLNVTICVSGYLKTEKDFIRPWICMRDIGDQYAITWETKELMALAKSFSRFLQDEALGLVATTLLQQTLFAGLLMAISWPATLMQASKVIDNPWSIGMERAQQLGIVMADILATYRQGKRPVTLIGYSLGARAIFVCLQELARRNLLGIVEDAFLIGTPAPSEPNAWNEASKAVAGRFVNAYATNDWFLAFVYRATSVQLKIAGIHPVASPSVENIDITDLVPKHFKLRSRMPLILERVGADVDPVVVAAKRQRMERKAAEKAAAAANGKAAAAIEDGEQYGSSKRDMSNLFDLDEDDDDDFWVNVEAESRKNKSSISISDVEVSETVWDAASVANDAAASSSTASSSLKTKADVEANGPAPIAPDEPLPVPLAHVLELLPAPLALDEPLPI